MNIIPPQSNAYLDQVIQAQAKVDNELRRKAAPPASPMQAAQAPGRARQQEGGGGGFGRAAPDPVARSVDVRVTGWFRWKNVVVPPNAYVVHTRKGSKDPVNVGLGISFSFNPGTDSFLVIPATMQTIIINANCICAERQGVLVQAYVQWIIDDIQTAYRKLDFSDLDDPMRVVNVQLREQAEAAIKDKVSTMPIDEILSDKQPIIAELTHRLRGVAEGSGESGGLGLKIVTVQIKEAVVSSTRMWEFLQRPFRSQREMLASTAELEARRTIAARELETDSQLQELRAAKERERYDREQAELARRQAVEIERIRLEGELSRLRHEQDKIRLAEELELEAMRRQAQAVQAEQDVVQLKARRAIENDVSENLLRSQLTARLPEIAQALPKPAELKSISIGPDLLQGLNERIGDLLRDRKTPAPHA